MLTQSENIAALSAALAKAQGAIEGAVKGKTNPAFKSKYADLASVWDACREALTDNGLAVIQSPGPLAEGRMEMTTMLVHSSGEWVRGVLTIPLGKADAHGYGSATTYARRFALAAFVGVAPEDDDGNAAAKAAPKRSDMTPANGPAIPANGRKTSAQAGRDGDNARLKAAIGALDLDGLQDWEANFDALTADLPLAWLDPVRDMLAHRREDLMFAASDDGREAAEMDAAFAQTVAA